MNAPLRPILRALGAISSSLVAASAFGALKAERLRCESLENPLGIDSPVPRLGWALVSEERGQRQTAFQALVARSPEALAGNRGELWDSGKVVSGRLGAEYGGKPLTSGERCFWKVRSWDARGKAGPWSEIGTWGVGLLHRADWKAEWITSPLLANPANRPRTPIRCYRSKLASDPNEAKWIVLDLGASRSIDEIVLAPARPNGLTFDTGTVQFPRRFRLEAAARPDFRDRETLVDATGADYPEPRGNACVFKFAATKARYVRLWVTRLGGWDAHDFGVFLAQFSVLSGGTHVSVGASVSASDSVEDERWSKAYLTDGKPNVEFGPFPTALDPGVPGAFSPSRTAELRRDFVLDAPVRRATLYGTARGFYEARINGRKVGNDHLAPGFTDYHVRQSYQTYDVTSLLRKGENSIAALLGYGWYAGHMNLAGNAYFYGYFPQLAAQLEIELTDGRRLTLATDRRWRTTLDGPVRWSDLLDGEACDFRRENLTWQAAWSQPLGPERRVAQQAPPVREIRTMKPVGRKEVRPGVWVYDLGQEITGWVRLRADGPAGTHVVIRHAEAIKPDVELDAASLWGTLQRDDYLLDGKGPRTVEPHFTYHGFRYFEVSGLNSPPTEIVAVNLHSDVEEVGSFECSNPLFNRLMAASKWTQRNLLFDVPAGCAARSERLAWTGDIRPCVQTAMFDFDTAAFFEKYAADLRDDQKADGRFTDISPHAHLKGTDICVGSPGWADAGVSLPWEVYVNTGDRRVLADHYDAAKRWVDFVHAQNPDLLWTKARGMDWGDWLSAGRATPKEIGSTAFFAHSVDLVSRMARVLGHKEDAEAYESLFDRIKAAFVVRYVSPDGIVRQPDGRKTDVLAAVRARLKDGPMKVDNGSLGVDPAPNALKALRLKIQGDSQIREYPEGAIIDLKGPEVVEAVYGAAPEEDAQGSYALALRFGLLDEPLRSKAVARLRAVIARDGNHPTTGFWSSVELLLALSDAGQNETASQLANLTTRPSLGHMVSEGGTTFWEAFDADQKTLSLNHWTHSACGEWLWRNVAGLNPDPEKPGYEGFVVRPRPSAEVSWCKARYVSIRGSIQIEWRVEQGRFELTLQVPPGSVAQVAIPGAVETVQEGGQRVNLAKGVRFLRMDDGLPVYEVASGAYRFSAEQK